MEVYMEHAEGSSPKALEWCPAVASLVGSNIDTNTVIILPIRCRKWHCPFCWIPNEIILKERVLAGDPNRMLTLTARPNPGETPKQMNVRVRPCVSRLYQLLRREIGEWEAVTFLELHRSGMPHWHALARSKYVAWATIRDMWQKLTGSYIVDIRQIKDRKIAARYVTKYVTKQLRNTLALKVGMIVRFTKHYSLKDKTVPANGKMTWQRDPRHPIEVQEHSYKNWQPTWQGRICTLTPPTNDHNETTRQLD